MSTPNLKTLISKLNPASHQALEKAAGLCLNRSHYNIELEHWLLALLQNEHSAFNVMLRLAQCNTDRLQSDINASLEALKTGNDQTPALSHRIIELINEAWLLASLEYAGSTIHSGILLCAILQNTVLQQVCAGISREFARFDSLNPRALLAQALNDSEENQNPSADQSIQAPAKTGKQTALAQFTTNLNEQARAGRIDAAIGREDEIRQVIDILGRRRQNNAILTGEPGVGKTAIVEGLALRIVTGDVPDNLKNVVVHSLDIGLLQAGEGVKGEFENRLKNLIQEVKQSPQPIILFIDEAHTLIGAGAGAGQNDAANLLKPALARGELRSIAATTWSEYKQYFEKDAALTRRFQVVKVEEPDAVTAMRMLRSLVASLEKHHQVKILDSAVQSATLLSQRYITGRQLPDKSISVLDTASARVASKMSTTPAEIEKLQKLLEQLAIEQQQLDKESKQGLAHQERLSDLAAEIKSAELHVQALQTRWQKEKQLVDNLLQLNEQGKLSKTDTAQRQRLLKQLSLLQGDMPLVQAYVDEQAVAEVIADWTGIPVGRMLKDEIGQILELAKQLQQRIVGQDHALTKIAATIKSSRAKLTDPNKPSGVFLFVGPSGVGKTETALALAENLYGSDEKMTVINMSEFKEEHKVSLLAGSPPGYVGYGEGGVLTEAVRRKPYSLVLLDEMEKAHPGLQDVFYQVFDKGMLKDGQGRDIDFKNTLIIMTSNAASEQISKLCADPETQPEPDILAAAIHDELLKHFKPAFLGRVTVIPYLPLSETVLENVVRLKLKRIQDRMQSQHRVKLEITAQVVSTIISRCNQADIGARQVDNILAQTIVPEISEIVLNHLLSETPLTSLEVTLSEEQRFTYMVNAKNRKKTKRKEPICKVV